MCTTKKSKKLDVDFTADVYGVLIKFDMPIEGDAELSNLVDIFNLLAIDFEVGWLFPLFEMAKSIA